jgi:hypothetical protein
MGEDGAIRHFYPDSSLYPSCTTSHFASILPKTGGRTTLLSMWLDRARYTSARDKRATGNEAPDRILRVQGQPHKGLIAEEFSLVRIYT